MLLLASLIWGFAFAAQSAGMEYIGPFTFTACRSLLGAAALLPVIFVLDRHRKDYLWLKGGLLCGLCLSVAMTLQQVGLVSTSAGKSGFLTALYILFVPILGTFVHRLATRYEKLGVLIALAGFYFLCMKESFTLAFGDLVLIGCAVVFAVHILVIDRFSPYTSSLRMSAVQFLVAGLVNAVLMFLFEQPTIPAIERAWLPIAYAGIMSSAVAYTLQMVGQKHTRVTQASLIMSLESVFSVLAGWVILNQKLSESELFGCLLIFIAICLAQIEVKEK